MIPFVRHGVPLQRGRRPGAPAAAALRLPGAADCARRLLRLLLLLLLLLLLAAGARAGETHPLDRTLSLDLWGAGLEDAAREIQARTGVGVVFYRPELPGLGVADRVYLLTGTVTLRTVLECLAWRFSLRYRVAASGRIEISRGYGWAGGEPALRILRLAGITPRDGVGPPEMRALLTEFAKPLPLLPEGHALLVEDYPTPAHPGGLRATAALPPVLADYLARAVACLAGGPAAPSTAGTPFAHAGGVRPDWPVFLGQTVPALKASDLRGALLALARASDAAFVLCGSPSAVAGAADLPEAGLGVMTEVLAGRFGLGRRVFLSGRAVGFRGEGEGSDVDSRSREIFWDGLAVAGFDARAAAMRLGGGDELARELRRSVRPWLWRDGVCALAYSSATGRLAVVAPANVVAEVGTRLRELAGAE